MKAGVVKELKGPNQKVLIYRNEDGIPQIEGQTLQDIFFAQGWIHAHDRLSQIYLMSIIGKGRASEELKNTAEFVAFDILFRKMNFQGKIRKEIEQAQEKEEELQTLSLLDAYSNGINFYRDKHLKPIELILGGINTPRWTAADSLLISKMMGYIGLSQGQEEVERFIIQAIKRGTKISLLEELFHPHLHGIDRELIMKVNYAPIYPLNKNTPSRYFPFGSGSNNWVVSPKKSESGAAIFCNDPHLEINRLPAIWYEVVLRLDDQKIAGVSIPGIPGVFIGRNKALAFGVTYAMADTTDFWIQDCKQGRYLLDGKRREFTTRDEKIRRKHAAPLFKRFFELADGSVLENEPLKNGYYLSLRWAGDFYSSLQTVSKMLQLNQTSNVKEAMKLVSQTAFPSLNWLFADKQGNIGMQVGGAFPHRVNGWSGLYPIQGWKSENLWGAPLSQKELPQNYNPSKGFLATANNDTNQRNKPKIINLPLPPYRVNRISSLLKKKTLLNSEDMKAIQLDTYSIQAEKFLKLIKPYFNEGRNSTFLNNWDLTYNVHEYGASVFENIYQELILSIFGDQGLGRPWLKDLLQNTSLGEALAQNFDRILLKKDSKWCPAKEHDFIWHRAVKEALNRRVHQWGKRNEIMLQNIFFEGKLPSWMGFDAGPYPMRGGRASVSQGLKLNFWGRKTTMAPSYRLIADFNQDLIETSLPGGSSGRRFSFWYINEVNSYFQGIYKKVEL